jgi:nitrate reductase gamma subunit
MQPGLILKYGVIISFFISIVSLIILVLKTFSFGKRELYAAPKGNVSKGIVYAFGKGMMPWEKESAVNHLPSYIGGILYHIGVFAALLYLFFAIVSIDLPNFVIFFLRGLFQVGFISGVALLFKRIFSPAMRTLSCPDDFAANIIIDIFVISALFHTFFQEITPLFFLTAIIMFLYIPLGKIRHCFFFFYIRILFGIFYGRRDVFPPKPRET